MTLKEEFSNEIKKDCNTNLELLFKTSGENYIHWLESKLYSIKSDINVNEKTNLPQIHLSSNDGKNKEESTEIVFHKYEDGTIFIEWYLQSELQKKLKLNQLQANFSKEDKNMLIKFLNYKTTY